MPEGVSQESVEFMTRFVGASFGAFEEFLLDWYWSTHPEARNQFPFNRPAAGLPRYSDLIIPGIQIPPWVIGMLLEDEARKKGDTKTAEMARGLEQFGEGGILFTVPKLVHDTAVLNTPKKAAASRPQPATTREQLTGTVYRL